MPSGAVSSDLGVLVLLTATEFMQVVNLPGRIWSSKE